MTQIGYYEEPKNGSGIIRARTSRQIRSWEFHRSEEALDSLNREWGAIDYPGIYILFEGEEKVYVGEAKSLYNRLKTHTKTPEEKIKKWNKVLVLSDGRPAAQSDFNDNVIRHAVEYYLIELFKANRYEVVSQGEQQSLNAGQNSIMVSLIEELNYFLQKKNLIERLLERTHEREVFADELKKILVRKGKTINSWKNKEAIVDGEKVFIRPGSKKPAGWQITFRGRKTGSFIDSLAKGRGYILISRNGVLLIPLSEVQKVIEDRKAYEQDTIDIWINFQGETVTLRYKSKVIDVTKWKLL
jgi:predicted GIY-YIG superfamily endonuclease